MEVSCKGLIRMQNPLWEGFPQHPAGREEMGGSRLPPWQPQGISPCSQLLAQLLRDEPWERGSSKAGSLPSHPGRWGAGFHHPPLVPLFLAMVGGS